MKHICKKTIVLILLIIFSLSANISLAVTQSEINSQKNKQSDINNQISENEEKKKEIEAEKSETLKQVESLNSQIDSYETQISELDDQIDEANKKIKESEQKLKENQDEYEKKEEMLKQRLVAVYESGETSYLDFLLSSESLTDFISNYYLVSEVTSMDSDLLEKLNKQKEEIENSKKEIESSKNTLTTSKAAKENVSTQLKSAKTEKNKYVEKLSDQEKEIQAHIEELKTASAQIEKEIKAAQDLYKKQLEELQKRSQSSSSSNSSSSGGGTYTGGGNGTLQRPVSSGSISAGMYYPSGSYHGAIDYAVPSGTPVYAAAEGVVIKTANLTSSYGTYVVIQHANGLQTWYAHGTSGSICVSPGQIVSRGQQIMLSGNSGHSTGPHLHFEVRVAPYSYSTCRVNPANYM